MMRLRLVTITGADDTVQPRELHKLTVDYPFVEWAILFSITKQGMVARYPSVPWMAVLSNYGGLPKAAHLCGGWARQAMGGDTLPFGVVEGILGRVLRVQLNISPYRLQTNHEALARFIIGVQASSGWGIPTIIQTDQPNAIPWLRTNIHVGDGYQKPLVLDDKSGGMGVRGKFDRPPFLPRPVGGPKRRMAGFAGGITPDNVVEVLEEIQAMPYDLDYWIDLESGVRTGQGRTTNEEGETVEASDVFDPDKAEAVLKKAKAYVYKEPKR